MGYIPGASLFREITARDLVCPQAHFLPTVDVFPFALPALGVLFFKRSIATQA
jgi:hypothetical protein